MRIQPVIAVLCFFVASSRLLGVIDGFVEIRPSSKAEGYHTKLEFKKQGGDRLLLTLPRIGGAPDLEAWLVVCGKERKKGSRNFRYDVHWPASKANKPDIELVIPVKFGKDGIANLQLTDDLASRSYIVFGGHFDDGTFYTIDLPSFRRALEQ